MIPRRTSGPAGHPQTIHDPAAAQLPVISPFHLDTEPMHALALFNVERDPDTVDQGLEPQAFDDEQHGHGLLVIGWRVDGRVDVFHDPALRLDPAGSAIAGAGLHRMVSRELSGGRFEIEVVPSGGWTPGDAPAMARLLFRLVKMFRRWPTTYRWSATVELADHVGVEPSLTSRWERIV